MLHKEADEVLNAWLKHAEQCVHVAVDQAQLSKLTAEDFTRLLLVRRHDRVCWCLQGPFQHIDVYTWFRETGS